MLKNYRKEIHTPLFPFVGCSLIEKNREIKINKFGFVEELNENTQQNEINLINEEENGKQHKKLEGFVRRALGK